LANPNDLGAWFGFCALVFSIRGLESRQPLGRWVSWGVALFCLFVLGLTVSRGPLIALAVALAFVFRKQLRRSLIPIVGLIILAGLAFVFGFFDRPIEQYMQRGMQETGRFLVWPRIIDRVIDAPLTGVGVSNIITPIPHGERTPHNGILFVALGAGLVPLVFFLGYWAAGLRGALRGARAGGREAVYLLPIFVYAFLEMLILNMSFAVAWAVFSVCMCLHHLVGESGASGARNRATPLHAGEPRRVFAVPGF
jgi:O-antigen ligase